MDTQKIKKIFEPDQPHSLSVIFNSHEIQILDIKYNKSNDNFYIEDYAHLNKKIDENLEDIDNIHEIAMNISEVYSKLSTRNKNASSIIPSFVSNIKMPKNLTDEEIKNQIEFNSDNYMPMALEEVNFDFEVLDSANNYENNILLAVCQKQEVDNYQAVFDSSGLNIKLLDIEQNAFQNSSQFLYYLLKQDIIEQGMNDKAEQKTENANQEFNNSINNDLLHKLHFSTISVNSFKKFCYHLMQILKVKNINDIKQYYKHLKNKKNNQSETNQSKNKQSNKQSTTNSSNQSETVEYGTTAFLNIGLEKSHFTVIKDGYNNYYNKVDYGTKEFIEELKIMFDLNNVYELDQYIKEQNKKKNDNLQNRGYSDNQESSYDSDHESDHELNSESSNESDSINPINNEDYNEQDKMDEQLIYFQDQLNNQIENILKFYYASHNEADYIDEIILTGDIFNISQLREISIDNDDCGSIQIINPINYINVNKKAIKNNVEDKSYGLMMPIGLGLSNIVKR